MSISENASAAALAKLAEQVTNLARDMAVANNENKHVMAGIGELKAMMSEFDRRVAVHDTFRTQVLASVNMCKWLAGVGCGSGITGMTISIFGG